MLVVDGCLVLFGVRFVVVVSELVSVVCCELVVVWCLLCASCWLLFVGSCVLFVVCGVLWFVVRCMSRVACMLLIVVCWVVSLCAVR